MYAPNYDVRHYGMMSQSVVLECQQGSEIWLEADATDDCYIVGDGTYRYSSFGAFLIKQI